MYNKVRGIVMKLKCLLLSVVFIFTCLFTGCGDNKAPHKVTGIYFDTVVELTVFGEKVPEEALELCEKYELLFSTTNEESEIYKLNKNGTVMASPETLEVIKLANEFYVKSDGMFDIGILYFKKLWGFDSGTPKIPTVDEQREAIHHSVFPHQIEIKGNRITLKESRYYKNFSVGGGLDLGAIAKGYIADKIGELYKEKGLSGIINLGGNVLTVGQKPDGEAYKIGVKKPFTENETLCTLELGEASVVTCGTYERYFERDGKIYHHIINPKEIRPCESGLQAVTVIAKSSTMADVLSTTLFLFGEARARKFLKDYPDTYAIFVRDNGDVSLSDGFESADFVKTDTSKIERLSAGIKLPSDSHHKTTY